MPENTDHPTQKPEKLIAKLILASSRPGDVVLDPFAGSGTTAVVAKKTNRKFIAIEMDELYCWRKSVSTWQTPTNPSRVTRMGFFGSEIRLPSRNRHSGDRTDKVVKKTLSRDYFWRRHREIDYEKQDF
jgi:hypothetical protein